MSSHLRHIFLQHRFFQHLFGARLPCLVALLVAGCCVRAGSSAAEDPEPADPGEERSSSPEDPQEAEPPASPLPEAVAGTWSSATCGDRGWERVVVIEAGGTFHAQDRIAPCPPGAKCVWSGIVHIQGTAVAQEEGVRLEVVSSRPRPPQGFPSLLRPPAAEEGDTDHLADHLADHLVSAESGCVFERVPDEP